MKILFLSPWFPYPPENGSKIRIYNLIKILSKHHDVRLISFVRKGEHIEPEGLNNVCKLEGMIPWREFNPNSWKSLAGFFSPVPRSVIDTYNPHMAKQLQRTIEQDCPDLIIASGVQTAIYAGRKWNIPGIFEEVELGLLYQLWATSTSVFTKIRQKIYLTKVRAFTRYLLKQYDACTVVSEKEQELLYKIATKNRCVNVIPNGVDLTYNRPGLVLSQPDLLVYSGSLTFGANFDAMHYFLRDIFPLIRAQAPKVTLKITGTITGVDLSSLPADDNIIFTDFLTDIRPAVAEAWACIVPLRIGGGTRLKILESMALGTPVIATSKAAEGLCVSPEKNILLADNPEEFASQTIRILRDNRLRDELVKNARELVVNQYGWDSIGSLFEQVIESVMNN